MSRIETIEIRAGDRMTQSASKINGELARFCELLAEADRAQEWLADGSPNAAQWLTARFGIETTFGRRLLMIARRLQSLPELSKRFASGSLSLDAVELLAEVATPESEVDLLDEANGRDLADIARIASRRKPPTVAETARRREGEWLATQWDLHRQRLWFRGELTGVEAQMVEDRLVGVAQKMPPNLDTGEYDDWNKRMADALVETCATDDGEGTVPVLSVHAELGALTDDDGVAEIGLGPVVPNEVARMLGCDCEVETVFENRGKVVGVGRKTRKIPGWLRRQVESRDHHCQAPGCERTAFLQIHHLHHWVDGGPTDLDNLILLCWWHHIFIHEKGWHITRDPDGRFVFRKSDWTPYPPRSP